MIMRLTTKPVNALVIQIYAPCEDEDDEVKDSFYDSIDKVIEEFRKGRECLVVMGDFNAKVGNNREDGEVGPFGVGVRNCNGER